MCAHAELDAESADQASWGTEKIWIIVWNCFGQGELRLRDLLLFRVLEGVRLILVQQGVEIFSRLIRWNYKRNSCGIDNYHSTWWVGVATIAHDLSLTTLLDGYLDLLAEKNTFNYCKCKGIIKYILYRRRRRRTRSASDTTIWRGTCGYGAYWLITADIGWLLKLRSLVTIK